MKKYETKMLFWTIVNSIKGVSDTRISKNGKVIGYGMSLKNDFSVIFYEEDCTLGFIAGDKEFLIVDENSDILVGLKDFLKY